MMTDDKKTSRWVKSLDKAGIIDPSAESWELPETREGEPLPPIVVDECMVEPPPLRDEPETIPLSEADTRHFSACRTTDSVLPKDMPVNEFRRQLHQRFDVGDFSGVLELAERLLKHDQEDQEASMYKLRAKTTLMQMFEARIGSFKRIPTLTVSKDDMLWHNLDATAAFIASNVDGTMSFEDIVDISTVSRFDTCRILSQLLQEGIIE